MWQNILVLLIILGAAVFLGYRIRLWFKGAKQGKCSCDQCPGCEQVCNVNDSSEET